MILLLHRWNIYIRLDLSSNFSQLFSEFQNSTLEMLNIVPPCFDLVGFGGICLLFGRLTGG